MKIILSFVLALLTSPAFASSDGIPRCWSDDQVLPVQDGLFRVFIPTFNTDAMEVALTLGLLSQSLTSQKGVAVSQSGDRIEIDVFGDLKYWTPTAAFPTLSAWKDAIVQSVAPVLILDGVWVECASINRHTPVP